MSGGYVEGHAVALLDDERVAAARNLAVRDREVELVGLGQLPPPQAASARNSAATAAAALTRA